MNKWLFILILVLALVACTEAEPVVETVSVTREVVVTEEVEVTREVPVEVTRIVVEEITSEVEVPVEVTRLVEVTRVVEVTAVPTETPVPTATPTSPPTVVAQPTIPPPRDLQADLLAAMLAVRTNMQSYGGLIDTALREGIISCQAVVDTYDLVAFAPVFDVTAADPVVQNAYGIYRNAISIFTAGTWDMTENCRTFLADPEGGTTIGFQQWGQARSEVNTALDALHPGIQSLGGE